MANELRTRTNFVGGLVEDNPLTNVATTLTSAGLAALPVIDTTNHAALILDPDGIHGPPEIVWVTAHTASSTTATILRAQESTSARQHLRDTYWVHTATVRDFLGPRSSRVFKSNDTPATGDVQWTDVDYDDLSIINLGASNTTFTLLEQGLYLIVANIYLTNTDSLVYIRVDGTSYAAYRGDTAGSAQDANVVWSGKLSSSQTIAVNVGGGGIRSGAAAARNWLSITKLS